MKILNAGLFVALVLLPASLCAEEVRIWKDSDGKTIEAEYVKTLGDKVVLQLGDGQEIRVSLNSLSKRDQRYLKMLAIPRIDLDVSVRLDRENVSSRKPRRAVQIQSETIEASVSVQKTSPAPYDLPLRVELSLLGKLENKDVFVVLSRSGERFRFSAENENAFSVDSSPVSLQQLESGVQRGVEYAGYVAAVTDRAGELIAVKGSESAFEEHAAEILTRKRGDVMDAGFDSIKRKKVRKQVMKGKRKVPGKRF